MIEGHLVDLVPFEDDFAIHLAAWMNEEAWFRTMIYDRREPHTENDVKKYIEKMEKNKRGALFGYQTKNGDPIGGVIYDYQGDRVWKADVMSFAGDTRYEGTDEQFDGLLMLIRYCFETRNLYRLEGAALAFDTVKIEQFQRAGFTHEGTLRQHIRWGGDYVAVEMFGLLHREWPGYDSMIEALGLQSSAIEPKPKPEKLEKKD
ncbi:MAG: GNAT family N-acetyltransferase [Anaerolineae bacterium]|nr:GNAT family N-acetyltransferase [Anaerolineae bacterium]